MIRGEINSSESLSQVSPEVELVFRALLLAVDDFGRGDARPAVLKASLFPLRAAFTPKRILACIEELTALEDPPVVLYTHAGRPYLYFPNWDKHRWKSKRAEKSRFPDPPRTPEDIRGDSGRSSGIRGDPRSVLGSGSDDWRLANAEEKKINEALIPEAGAHEPFALKPDPEPAPEKKTQSADGKRVLERMAAHAEVVSSYLGLPALDCRWTVPRQKLISAAHKAYPEHGAELGVAVLEGFRRRAAEWTPSIQLGSWSVEAMFAPANVGKNLQAIAVRVVSAAPTETAEPLAPMDFGQPIGAT